MSEGEPELNKPMLAAAPVAVEMQRLPPSSEDDGQLRPEMLFPGGVNAWHRGMFGCTSSDAFMCAMASCCCWLPCAQCLWGHQLQSAVGSRAEVVKCLCGLGHAPYAAGKMAHALNIHEDIDAGHCLAWACCFLCQALRFKAEAEDRADQLSYLDRSGSNNWKQPLFSCCDDPLLAALVCCVPCVPMGQFYATLGKNCCLYGLCGCHCLEYARGKLVAAKRIHEPFAEYVAKVVFCGPCAACQLFAELKESRDVFAAAAAATAAANY